MGLRADRRPHAGPEGPVRGRVRHRQDDGRAGAGRRLGLEIFRVDLATTVRKYIGETEKNLDRIFGEAEGSNAILFFDEADALFGKRTEVGDSHDRYANIEVAYLLQKMEGYPGAVILATNLRHNIDDAFVRRLDFVIDFPFPEADDRRRIWDRVLPDQAPRAEDVDLDFLSESSSSPAARSATARWPRRSRPPTTTPDLDAPPRARRRAGVRQAGPAHARSRLRALPRRDPRRRRPRATAPERVSPRLRQDQAQLDQSAASIARSR